MRRRRISSCPAGASKCHLPPPLDDRDRHRPVLGADRDDGRGPRGVEFQPHAERRASAAKADGVVAVCHGIRGRHQRVTVRIQDRLQLGNVELFRSRYECRRRFLGGGELPLRRRRRWLFRSPQPVMTTQEHQSRRQSGYAHGHGAHRRPPPPAARRRPPAAATPRPPILDAPRELFVRALDPL